MEIHDHELLTPIGRGAYGEVWLARNALGAGRAVKIVFRKDFDDNRPFEREFAGIQKFEPISRSHPGLVHILQVGRREDYFYYVMELADSAEGPNSDTGVPNPESSDASEKAPSPSSYVPRTLREDLRRQAPLPAQRCLEVGLSLASALSHLHQQGLIHRDIKPSNIIFVRGTPKLADIGLVTEVGDSRSIVGTEGYLPPEGPGAPQADIFSLGKVLYEISTGQDRRQFPDLPPELRQSTDAATVLELNEVVLRACANDAQKRYASADQMQADLECLAQARSLRRHYEAQRRWRLVRRASIWLVVVATAFILILLAIRPQPAPSFGPTEKRSTNEAANAWYDKGVNYLDRLEGAKLQMAANCFEQAVRVDPGFAQAWALLAWTCTWHTSDWNTDNKSLFPKAKHAAEKALSLDPSLALPHIVLGAYAGIMRWDWPEGERQVRIALELAPRSPDVHLSMAEGLRMRGHMDQALKELDIAQSYDRRSVTIAMRRAEFLSDAKKFDQALTQLENATVMAPDWDPSWNRAFALCGLNRYSDALKALRQSQAAPNAKRELDELASALSSEGPKAWWRWELKNALNQTNRYEAACAYAQLGETNAALACLQQDLQDRMWRLPFSVMTDWRLDPIRADTNFNKIVKEIGLK